MPRYNSNKLKKNLSIFKKITYEKVFDLNKRF